VKIFVVLRDVAPHLAYLEVSRLLHVLAGFVGLRAVVVDERPFYPRNSGVATKSSSTWRIAIAVNVG
jgi:hypothetical protein